MLTDEKFFQGSLDYLRQIRAAVKLPLLRKDFIIDERQILEAVEWGADAILLIVAILTDAQLKRFPRSGHAGGAGRRWWRCTTKRNWIGRWQSSPELIGVNNRDLKTFKVDLATTERLAAKVRVPAGQPRRCWWPKAASTPEPMSSAWQDAAPAPSWWGNPSCATRT